MQMNWMLTPLAQYAALAAAMVACLALFVGVKFEMAALRRRFEAMGETAGGRLDQMEEALKNLRETFVDAGERAVAEKPGLNLTRRAQALRMYRRGEAAPTIAAALKAPRNEIELLLRIQEMQAHGVDSE